MDELDKLDRLLTRAAVFLIVAIIGFLVALPLMAVL